MRYYGVQNEVKAYCNRLQNETSITVTPSLVKTLNDRVESLKKSGAWSQYSLGFNDQDADSYFQRASVNDVLGRSEVCWFVRGMKALGLWQNAVCWPLRSYQNVGTGSTAYSLGGLGTFDGTLINSPTWGLNGIDFNGSNQRVTLPNNAFGAGNAATSIWAFAKNDTNAVRMNLLSHGDNNTPTDSFSLESPDFVFENDIASIAFTGLTIATKSILWKGLFIGNTSFGFYGKDGGTITQFTLNNTLNKSGTFNAIGAFGFPAGVAPFDGLVASVIRISIIPTTQLNRNVYNLYKSTLGSNLELP
jgi:hypothetical protein